MRPVQSALDLWNVVATTAGATSIAATQAAGAAGVYHVAKRVMVTVANNGATAQPPVQIHLLDGSTILAAWSVVVAAVSTSGGGFAQIDADNLDLVGSNSTAMSVTCPALGATTNASINLIGYDLGRAPQAIPIYVTTAAP